jgi:hypothetical protein
MAHPDVAANDAAHRAAALGAQESVRCEKAARRRERHDQQHLESRESPALQQDANAPNRPVSGESVRHG